MIKLNSLSLQRSGRYLIKNSSLTINSKDRVGLIGANGCGKSSFFALLNQNLTPDQGDISINSSIGIAHMSQEIEALNQQAIEYVIDGDPRIRQIQTQIDTAQGKHQYEKLSELYEKLLSIDGYTAKARATQMLVGLGFQDRELNNNVKNFSGGWRMRLNLARTLMQPSDILLLDEPTNHLDLSAILWLENFLKKLQSTLIIISHDKDFLDSVVTSIIHFEHQKLQPYSGNYSEFEKMLAMNLEIQKKTTVKLQSQKAHIESFVKRFQAKASKAKQVQSRIKALARLEEVAAVYSSSPFTFSFPEPDKIPSPLLAISDGVLGYNNNITLSKFNLTILPNSRIGLLGINGCGKSTLIKALAQELALLAGKRIEGDQLKIGYFAQHQLEKLDINASPLLHLSRITPTARDQEIRNFLGSFGFQGDNAINQITDFSGGEKARLALAIIAWQKPNLLLLDEPTNHLDLDMRHSLMIALQKFSGAMILVSHDRNLIKHSTDELMLLNNGSLSTFQGDCDDYSHWLLNIKKLEHSRANVKQPTQKAHSTIKSLQKKASKLEKELEKYINQLKNYENELANKVDENNKSSNPTLKEAGKKQKELRKIIEETENEWLIILEKLEERQKNTN